MNEIILGEKTVQKIKDYQEAIERLREHVRIIIETVLTEKNVDGNFGLTGDLKKLIRMPEGNANEEVIADSK